MGENSLYVKSHALSTYRCTTSPDKSEADLLPAPLRLGVVRYLPRAIKKEDYQRLGYFDLWFPLLAPSKELLAAYKEKPSDSKTLRWFKKEYLKEIRRSAETRQAILLIREMALRMAVSIGCYCEDEAECHRSLLYEEIINSDEPC